MRITVNDTKDVLTLETETRTIMLTAQEAYAIYAHMRKTYFESFLHETIDYAIEDNEIDLARFKGTKDEFIEEVRSSLELQLDDVESATETQIIDAVTDTATYYDLFG